MSFWSIARRLKVAAPVSEVWWSLDEVLMNLCLPYGVFIYFGKKNEALGGQGGQGELGEWKGVGVNDCVKRGLRRGFKKKGGFCT